MPPIFVQGEERISIGDGVVILEGSSLAVGLGGRLSIGAGTHVLRFAGVACSDEVRIGRDVLTSDYVTLTDTYAALDEGPADGGPPPEPVIIGDGAYLGAHSVIGPGVHVGVGAFVGEGAVVLDDVPPHSVVYGNPAQVVRRLIPGPEGGRPKWVVV